MVSRTAEPLRSGVDFAQALARHGDRPALRDAAGVMAYDDLAQRVAEAADALGAERRLVHVAPEPTTDFVVAYLATLAAGHPVLLTDREPLAAAYAAAVARSGGTWVETGATSPDLHPDLQLLLSTSGSTGSPKLVRLSADAVDTNATAIADYLGLTCDDVALGTLPLDYCYGLSVLHSHLSVGASVVLTGHSVIEPSLWQLARDHGATSFAGVPHTFELLDATGWPDLPTLRQVTQAGGRLVPERVSALTLQGRREGWELFVMYGQTEATARMAYLPPALALEHPGTIGVAIPGGELRVDRPGSDGVGELVYSGPNVMMGYAGSRADLARGAELDELRTGDLARIDEAGLVEITGRAHRFAKLFGQRIDLDRVSALLAAEGYDAHCAESPDGRLVVALVGAADPITTELARAATADATGLPQHAIRTVAVAELPRRANGKPDLAAIARLGTDPEEATEASSTDPLTVTAAQFRAVLGVEVGPDDTFTRLGGDSLSYVELSVRLEARLRRLPNDWPTRTVADLATLHGGARRVWQWLDTTIALRAIAIVLIVGSHSNLFTIPGGAHVLLAVAGFNLARFVMADPVPRHRTRNLLRSTTRIVVPSMIWIAAVTVILGDYGWRNVLLLNDLLGPRDWTEPDFYFWFVEALVYFALAAAALTAIPSVARVEQRAPYAFALGLLALGLVPRYWADATGYDGDIIHSSLFVAWYFAGGWAAARATTVPQRALVSVVLLVATHGWFDDPQRELVVSLGILALVWVRAIPWPRLITGATALLASASLYIYLTHWQVYPHLEHDWPLGGVLASLAVGVAAWWLVERLTARSRETPRSPMLRWRRPRADDRPDTRNPCPHDALRPPPGAAGPSAGSVW